MTRIIRLGLRIVLVLAAAGVLYGAFNLTQVWWTSRQDDRRVSDAIIVLGAAQWDGKPSPVLQARLDHAVELFEEGVAPVVVVTGGNQPGDRVTQGFAAYEELRRQGVPEAAIRVEVDGTTTFEELSASANILDTGGIGNSVVLVSDPYHLYRSELIAAEVGLDAVGSPAGSTSALGSMVRETAAVSVGRIVSFRRLNNWFG